MAHAQFQIPLPSMTPGSARHVVVQRFGTVGARPKAYLQAAVHANEFPGAMALHHLMPRLLKVDTAGRIRGEVVVPTLNPIGLSQLVGGYHLGRYKLLGRDNFNRHWLDLTSAVAERVGARLGRDSAAGRTADAARRDREAVDRRRPDARPALRPGGLVALLRLAPRLAEAFADADIPQACLDATVEYRGQHDVNHALGATDAARLLRFLRRCGAVAGRPGKVPPLKAEATPISGMDRGCCPCRGILVYHAAKGTRVRKGQVICEVIDPADPREPQACTPMRAGGDGVLFARRLDGTLAWPGKGAFAIAGAKPLAHRVGMSNLDD